MNFISQLNQEKLRSLGAFLLAPFDWKYDRFILRLNPRNSPPPQPQQFSFLHSSFSVDIQFKITST